MELSRWNFESADRTQRMHSVQNLGCGIDRQTEKSNNKIEQQKQAHSVASIQFDSSNNRISKCVASSPSDPLELVIELPLVWPVTSLVQSMSTSVFNIDATERNREKSNEKPWEGHKQALGRGATVTREDKKKIDKEISVLQKIDDSEWSIGVTIETRTDSESADDFRQGTSDKASAARKLVEKSDDRDEASK